jgi:hypothetical protein
MFITIDAAMRSRAIRRSGPSSVLALRNRGDAGRAGRPRLGAGRWSATKAFGKHRQRTYSRPSLVSPDPQAIRTTGNTHP